MPRSQAASPPSDKLVGRPEPRLYTEPLRPLNRRTSKGFEVIDFARAAGEPLLPWQEWLAPHTLELLPDGTLRYRIVLVLVARQNGKSSVKRTVSLWRMYVDGARTILGLAQDVALAREQWKLCQETIHASPELEAEFGNVRNVNGDEQFWLTNGARYLIKAMNRKAGRGYSIDEANIDELREQRDWAAWSAVSKTLMARRNAQLWAMSNAGDDESVVLNQLREAALAGRDESIGIFEWSAPDGCELDDPAAIAQANPGLGHIIGMPAITSARATDPPGVYRTEVLCQRVESLDGAIDPLAWRDCRDPTGTMDAVRDRVVACVDVAPDGQHVTLATAATLADGRVRVEIVAAWKDTDTARAELGPLLQRIRPAALAWYPAGPAAELAPILRPPDLRIVDGRKLAGRREHVELTGLKVTEACQGLAGLVKARRIVHPDDPLLNTHTIGAQKLPSGDGWRFTRRAGHCDAAYAAAGAVHVALTLPAQARPRIRVIA